MSGYNLDQMLSGLKISNTAEGQQPPKKIGPAVPPKPKKPAQPLVVYLLAMFRIWHLNPEADEY